jgi:hypothetical protein
MVLAIGDMPVDNLLNVLPPLVQAGRFGEFIDAGRTLSMSLSPLDNSVATFVTVEVQSVTPGLCFHLTLDRALVGHRNQSSLAKNQFISPQPMHILHPRGDL